MSVRLLIAALTIASATAFAQGEETTAETPPAQPPADQVPVEKPVVKAPAVKLDPVEDKENVAAFAREFFNAIILGETNSVMNLSALPFYLEDKRLNTDDEFLQAWQKALRQKNTDLLTLYGIEVLTGAEMEKKYGKPPARLAANFPWKKAATYVAVANLSGHAAVVVFQKTPEENFIAIAYHD